MRFLSPLRYPGGKRKIAEFMKDIIVQNEMQGGTYIEPFAGGASIALFLLFNSYVNKIIINDIDRSIYAFWFCVINETDRLCSKIRETEVSVDTWKKQKEIQNSKETADLFDLGFSTFFLNRTNRSGVINGGMIGGKEQDGKWKIDARYNKENLIKRIKQVALHKNNIFLYCEDSVNLIYKISKDINEKTLIYFDPPYYNKGSTLYMNHFNHEDHKKLAEFIQELNCKWILTYDYTPEIINMYSDAKKKKLYLDYTAASRVKGIEMLAYSSSLKIPEVLYPSIKIE